MNFKRLYEDETIENKLKNIDFGKYDFLELTEEDNSYQTYYFLSHLRHNLFNWYPFKKDANLLEIGSSYGQLTELFTKKVNRVVCIEDELIKGEIISKRAPDAEIIISEFNDISIDEKFDYIILCNIFEYAKSFLDSKNPYEDYLIYLKNFLKEDGVILIAMSNRLGLNYFAGFKEEHSNLYFAGINGYNNVNYVETFSKTELENIIISSGFDNYKFFYPYPNHEFPLVIHTDKFVNEIPFERRLDYFDYRSDFFREDVLNQGLAKEGMAAYFANSFLVEIRNRENESRSDDIDFVKLNADRLEDFRTITTIKSDGFVYKAPFSIRSYKHIINMYSESKFKLGKIRYLDCNLEGNAIKYEILNEKSLEDYVLEAINNEDKEEFFRLLEDYYDALFYNSFESQEYADDKFLEVFEKESKVKFHCHNKSNLDLIFSNIFVIDGEFVAIDYEWIFDFQIPLEYIFYRCLLHYTLTNNVFKEFISIEEIFNYFNLDSSNFNLFRQWDHNFMKYVFGYLPKPQRSIVNINDDKDNDEELEDYVDLYLKSDDVDEDKMEQIKNDMVLNQRKIILNKIDQIDNLHIQINNKNRQINNLNNRINTLNQQINIKNRELEAKTKKINEFENSNSWKITKPIRKVNHALNKKRGE